MIVRNRPVDLIVAARIVVTSANIFLVCSAFWIAVKGIVAGGANQEDNRTVPAEMAAGTREIGGSFHRVWGPDALTYARMHVESVHLGFGIYMTDRVVTLCEVESYARWRVPVTERPAFERFALTELRALCDGRYSGVLRIWLRECKSHGATARDGSINAELWLETAEDTGVRWTDVLVEQWQRGSMAQVQNASATPDTMEKR